MLTKKYLWLLLFFGIFFIKMPGVCFAQAIKIKNDPKAKKVVFGNSKIKMVLDYDQKANISLLVVNGQKVIEGTAGVFSQIKTNGNTYSTLHLSADPFVKVNNNTISISGIIYGDKELTIHENWVFTITEARIKFNMDRTVSKPVIVEKAELPVFMFRDTATWEGAYQDYGGLAWFYLFNKKLDTYGVHSNSSRFWNSKTGNGLTISVNAPGKQVAMDY
ncbi:MAG: hypothetical protein ABJA71_14480, partial [Ginsengibacter sp.]